MTVQEAKEQLIKDCHMLQTDLGIPHDLLEEFDYTIVALEEVEQYRALGTVEELKEAREKQIPKKPNLEGDGYADGHLVYDTWYCPNCDKSYEVDYDDYDYCPNCGQKIDKSVFDEEEGGTSEVQRL